MPQPKVLCLVLGSLEREGWINPNLALQLIKYAKDDRFNVEVGTVTGYRPHDTARNAAMVAARQADPDWIIQLDNDVVPSVSPLDIIANAPKDAAVIGVSYGICGRGCVGKDVPKLYPPSAAKQVADYEPATELPGGVLCINSVVLRKFPCGPWFQINTKAGSEILEWGAGEDSHFCNLVRSAGLKVYLHKSRAGHLHTVDVSTLV
ncbi:MAG TPA: hypothetical protein VMP68_02405 [Candidatus Eisenbacteria bacterium]|nr:hypothetical protein [Candidatus Eisenbacteria bacterium]